MLKEQLCSAFCDRLAVTEVPCGFAVSTGFSTPDGDSIGFYVLKERAGFRLEDDGTTIPMIEALGVNLKADTRKHVFSSILSEHGFFFDSGTQILHSMVLREDEVADAALRFSAMLLRLQDLELLTPRVVEGAFREDALAAIHKRFEGRVEIVESAPFEDHFPNYLADVVLRRNDASLAAIYLGTSASRVDEAVMLHMDLELSHWREPAKVILLLETLHPSGVPERALARAHNRLDAIPIFRAQPDEAMSKIDVTVFGREEVQH